MAGLVGEPAETFDANFDDNHKKVSPASLCWTSTGDIYYGCTGGQLLKYDTETQMVSVLYNPDEKKGGSRLSTAGVGPFKMASLPDGMSKNYKSSFST